MIHLRIVAPAHLAAQALELLGHLEYVTSMAVFRGVGRKPEGDLILCNVAVEETSHVIADLRDLGIDRYGSILIGPPETEISALVPETRDTNSASDAVVWEEIEERTSESAELSGSVLLFMTIAILIAMVGIYLNSAILIIGAMIVGPDFGPIAGVCVAAVNRQLSEAGRSLVALLASYTSGIVAAYLMTLILKGAELIPRHFDAIDRSVENSITQPGFFPVLVALLAGAAGMLSLTMAKSGALIGVLVSVTTIPAAANIAVTIAYFQDKAFYASILQLATNVGAMFLAGTLTLAIQRGLFRRRRAAHLRELDRRGKGTKQ
jgi:uncharacterized hydrophobic protein (TIGR00271 family)